MKRFLALTLCISATAVLAGDLPSGRPATLQEVLVDTVAGESWLRFRFISEGLTRDADYEVVAEDMLALCEGTALPYIEDYALTGDVIVVSLSDRPTEFGVADPDATQVFEAFRPVDNACIWEGL